MDTGDLASPRVYQLHIRLREISPAIWRRVLVRSDSTITDLHYTIQLAMGWTDSHLNRFVIHGRDYGVYHIGGPTFSHHADDVRLVDLGLRTKERFLYEYDFGDCWQHDVRLEREVTFETKRTYPMCIGGRRACPPEDCGGPWGYMQWEDSCSIVQIEQRLVDFIKGEEDDFGPEVVEAMICWLERDRFDRREINRRLKQYAHGDREWTWSLC